MRHPAHTYRQLSVQGASPLEMVVMLYDGLITAMLRGIDAVEAHDIERKCQHLNRALAIILQLEGTLNFELGGEIARNLQRFYVYSRAKIMKANIESSAEALRSLIEYFTTLRDAWKEGERRLTIQESQGRSSDVEIHA